MSPDKKIAGKLNAAIDCMDTYAFRYVVLQSFAKVLDLLGYFIFFIRKGRYFRRKIKDDRFFSLFWIYNIMLLILTRRTLF